MPQLVASRNARPGRGSSKYFVLKWRVRTVTPMQYPNEFFRASRQLMNI